MMEKVKPEEFGESSPVGEACGSPRHDTSCAGLAVEGGEACGKQEGTTATEATAGSPRGGEAVSRDRGTAAVIIINGVTKETAYSSTHELKRDVPALELAAGGGGTARIKAGEHETDGSHTVRTTELRRPPAVLPPPARDPLSETRMVQLSPPAFPVPARGCSTATWRSRWPP
ncbi:hypothetical protein AAFF_G00032410 [Aldrovandia affinis]|uniref:Uncharacterized protein n=1 Tax=Aldrovandia affinis TaxID=143900 RepID=A0AAD7S3Z6_9TELE|nr:hypothetical protein AAFF_G00032410 [Aldrovandia affinis]